MSRISSVGRRCGPSIRKRSASTMPKRNGGVWRPRSRPCGVSRIPALSCPHRRHPRQRLQASIAAPASDLPDRPDLTDSTLPPPYPGDRGRLARSFLPKLRGGRDARGPRVAGAPGATASLAAPFNAPESRRRQPAHSFRNGGYDNCTIVSVTRRPPSDAHVPVKFVIGLVGAQELLASANARRDDRLALRVRAVLTAAIIIEHEQANGGREVAMSTVLIDCRNHVGQG